MMDADMAAKIMYADEIAASEDGTALIRRRLTSTETFSPVLWLRQREVTSMISSKQQRPENG